MDAMEMLAIKLPTQDISETHRQLALLEMAQLICNYCNVEEVPSVLLYAHVSMAADLLRWESAASVEAPKSGEGECLVAGAVASISEGDTSVSFTSKSAATDAQDYRLSARMSYLEKLITDHRMQLRAHRKVGW